MRKKKYISQRTRATHTYSFYRQRRMILIGGLITWRLGYADNVIF